MKQGTKLISNNIDGHYTDGEIANNFSDKYKTLFNLPESDTNVHNYDDLFDVINDRVAHESLQVSHVSTQDVIRAVNKLKLNKNDGVYDLSSNGFKEAPVKLLEHISALFTTFLKHGHVPAKIITCSMLPLIKNRQGDIASSDNYRAISLSTVLVKIFESVILHRCYETLSTSNQQFGFKRNHSTIQCTWLVNETIRYYNSMNTSVFCCLLDCTKAFDRISFSTLFTKLLNTTISGVILRCLLYMYLHQQSRVIWNNVSSELFDISNGVRQGSILSPILFGFYMEDLIRIVIRNKIGCKVGDVFTGILVYADDIVLLAPRRQALQLMVDTCSNYAINHNLLFSTNPDPSKSKSKCMYFDHRSRVNNNNLACILLNDKRLPYVTSAKHLGNTLDCTRKDKDISVKRGITIGKINGVLQEFNFAHPMTKCSVIHKYCTSFYGCELWDFYSDDFAKILTTWNIYIRKAWGVPNTTHRRFIEPLSGFNHVKVLIFKRFLNFFNQCMYHKENSLLNSMSRIICQNVNTVTGANLRRIWNETNINPITLYKKIIPLLSYHKLPENEHFKINIIKELTDAKFGIAHTILDYTQIEAMLQDICCN